MPNATKILALLFLTAGLCRSEKAQTQVLRYKTVTLDLNRSSQPSDTVAVVNLPNQTNVPAPYSKYVIFGTETNEYFNVSSVVLGPNKVTVDGKDLTMDYVYDVATYWKGSQILLAVFRYYYAGGSSYYQYFKRINKQWEDVKEGDVGGNWYGLLPDDKLEKLLNEISAQNRTDDNIRREEPAPKDEKKLTVIIVSVVVISLLILLIVGLAFYFFK